MKKFIFGFVAVCAFSMITVGCNCNKATNDQDSTAVDTLAVDSAACDSLVCLD